MFGRGSGQLPIHWAAESNHVDTARVLAEANLPTVFAVDERDRTPAQVAEKELALEAIDALTVVEATPMVLLRVVVEQSIAQPLGAKRPVATASVAAAPAAMVSAGAAAAKPVSASRQAVDMA